MAEQSTALSGHICGEEHSPQGGTIAKSSYGTYLTTRRQPTEAHKETTLEVQYRHGNATMKWVTWDGFLAFLVPTTESGSVSALEEEYGVFGFKDRQAFTRSYSAIDGPSVMTKCIRSLECYWEWEVLSVRLVASHFRLGGH